jgi:hypothetical protein
MVLKNTMVFFFREVFDLHVKKLCFEYHGLLDIMIFLNYLKFYSNPKFS